MSRPADLPPMRLAPGQRMEARLPELVMGTHGHVVVTRDDNAEGEVIVEITVDMRRVPR